MNDIDKLYIRLEQVLSELHHSWNKYAAIEADVLRNRIATLTKRK